MPEYSGLQPTRKRTRKLCPQKCVQLEKSLTSEDHFKYLPTDKNYHRSNTENYKYNSSNKNSTLE